MHLLIIIPLLMAALICLCLVISWHLHSESQRLRKIINNLYRRIDDTENSKDEIYRAWKYCHRQIHALRMAAFSNDAEYFMRTGDLSTDVCRRFHGKDVEYTVLIKKFCDKDADFNRREAEELLEQLNA